MHNSRPIFLINKTFIQPKKMLPHISLSPRFQSMCWPKPEYGPMEVMRSELMNGTKVASAKPLGAQIGACTIMYQAGSRYEADNTIGSTHFLRAMSSGSGCGFTSYIKSRYLQQNGGILTCSSDRQTISFTLRCPITNFADLKCYLLDTAAKCCYHEWEVSDAKNTIKDDFERITPEQMAMDLIQKASFGGALTNSVFCPPGRIKSMTGDNLKAFVKDNFTPVTCTVGSVGVPFEETLNMAEKIEMKRDKPPKPCTPPSYHKGGYEYFDLGAGSDTWVAIAIPGCGSTDFNCLLKHNIIAAACGAGHMQSGQHQLDRTPQPPLGSMAGNDVYTSYKAFNISYLDSGIFGILVKTRACSANQAAYSAVEFLSNISDLNFKQIETGKRRLKVSLALHDEDCVKVSEGLAMQIASNVQVDSAKNSMALIDQIPPNEVAIAAKMLANKKHCMSLAVVGDIGAVPPGREYLLN